MNSELTIHSLISSPDQAEASAQWDFAGQSWRIYFRSADVPLHPSMEGMVAATLLPAMKHGVRKIRSSHPASPRFLANLAQIQDYFHQHRPYYRPVEIEIPPRSELSPLPARVGAFFSAGLDSYYTLLQHQDEITDLIYIHGMDIPLHRVALRRQKSAVLREIARAFNKRLIEVETNLLSFNLQYVPITMLASSILASVGHQLGGELRRIYIASSAAAQFYEFSGTNSHLDPLWSSETLEFVHDGEQLTRVEKAKVVGESEIAMRTLQVCLERREGAYNCGKCEKCLRTMVNLRIAGVLERCSAFAVPLDLSRLKRLKMPRTSVYLNENIHALEESGQDPELLNILRQIQQPSWWKRLRHQLEHWRHRGGNKRRYRSSIEME